MNSLKVFLCGLGGLGVFTVNIQFGAEWGLQPARFAQVVATAYLRVLPATARDPATTVAAASFCFRYSQSRLNR